MSEFRAGGWWVQGIEFCRHEISPDQPSELDGFREWLHMKLDCPGNTNWQAIITDLFGNDEAATVKAFEQLKVNPFVETENSLF